MFIFSARVFSAAESNAKKVSLELGGKSPLIIFKDCDLEKAVRQVRVRAFWRLLTFRVFLRRCRVFKLACSTRGKIVLPLVCDVRDKPRPFRLIYSKGRLFVEDSIHDEYVRRVVR